jgi:predicted O-methyltransferase YrrM
MADRTIDARWTSVDDYITGLMASHDATLEHALSTSQTAHLPAINVTAPQGKFLHLLARISNATRILEIGTLGGYSTIWMARALPQGGRLVTIESDPRHANIARANLDTAGLSQIVDLREGKALDVLPSLEREHAGPFDLAFIDADKPNTAEYFSWALRLSRPGGIIVADNVVRDGAVSDAGNPDPSVRGMRRVLEIMAAEPRVSATVIQTVSAKGYDGFAIALVLS